MKPEFDADRELAKIRTARRKAAKAAAEKVAVGRALYSDDQGQPILRPSFALYLDELGAKERLDSLTNEELRTDLATYDDLRWFVHDEENWDNETQRALFFSDNLVVATPVETSGAYDDLGLFFQVFSAAAYQLNLAIRGRFLRGGLSAGPLYADHSFVTGKALVAAVLLEEKVAVSPRVILDDVCAALAQEDVNSYSSPSQSAHHHFLLVDADGHTFVNYLVAASEDEEIRPGVTKIGLESHRKHVELALAASLAFPRVHDKYEWVAAYHNYVLAEFYGDLSDLAIQGVPARGFLRFTNGN